MLDFEHADVAFSKVIVERHVEIGDKGKYRVTIAFKPFGQITGLGLPGSAPFAFRPTFWRWRIGRQGISNQFLIDAFDLGEFTRRQMCFIVATSCSDNGFCG